MKQFHLEIQFSNEPSLIPYSTNKQFNDDAGIDLYFMEDQTIPGISIFQLYNNDWRHNSIYKKEWIYDETKMHHLGVEINLGIRCRAYFLEDDIETPSAFRIVPRSSIYKTPLRMSNSEGIIDASYRGEIKIRVDNISNYFYNIKKGDRLFQAVAPSLEKIHVNIVNSLDETLRNDKGFGSTGK
jgi:dUTP pyrophosphatase